MNKLKLTYRKLDELAPHPRNARTHSRKQLEQLASSIRRFGFLNPVLIDDDSQIVAGHGRVEAARLLECSEVPTIKLAELSDAQVRAYMIADNRLAEKSGWDRDILATEFTFLSDLECDLDPTITGFELAEIDALMSPEPSKSQKARREDNIPALQEVAITQLGDIWRIGDHRLFCGNATEEQPYETLMESERATMVFSDPPYNVPIVGHVSGLGSVKHREFAMASGEMTSDEFRLFLRRTFHNLVRHSVDGSIHYHCMDWRHCAEILEAGAQAYSELKNICIWAKTNAGMGSLYRSGHEMIFVFKAGRGQHINNVELGKNGRHRTNVWTHPGANTFSASRSSDLAMHPTVKPTALVYDAILDCSKRKDIVLDPFAGSGTRLVAAHKARRRGFGIELDPLYCDTIIRRMQSLFKLQAVRDSDGRPFDECECDLARVQTEAGEAA